MAARSKACTVFARSNAGIVGSKITLLYLQQGNLRNDTYSMAVFDPIVC
jgi:hypothetical protein